MAVLSQNIRIACYAESECCTRPMTSFWIIGQWKHKVYADICRATNDTHAYKIENKKLTYQRNSVSATHFFLDWLTDCTIH